MISWVVTIPNPVIHQYWAKISIWACKEFHNYGYQEGGQKAWLLLQTINKLDQLMGSGNARLPD